MADPIKALFRKLGCATSVAAARNTIDDLGAETKTIRSYHQLADVIHRVGEVSWSSGVELGLAIAIDDIANGRRLLEWIRDDIYERDQQAMQPTIDDVERFRGVLAR